MALLVGQDGLTGGSAFFNPGEMHYFAAGYVAAASGTATSIMVGIQDTTTAENIVAAIYDSDGTRIGLTQETAIGTPPIDVTLPLQAAVAITAGQTYYLAMLADGYYIPKAAASPTFTVQVVATTYPTVPATIDPANDSPAGVAEFSIWADGTIDGGGSTDRRGTITWAEFEVPDAPTTDRRGLVTWAELQVPLAPRRGRVTWAELEAPDAPRRGVLTWAELQVPDVGAAAVRASYPIIRRRRR